MKTVLGIDVDDALFARWKAWLAPAVQPFFVESTRGLPKSLGGSFTKEDQDTFRIYSPKLRGKKVIWLDEDHAIEPRLWPSTITDADVIAFVEEMGEVPHQPHPNAPAFAGTFASGSGPNCFGAAMGRHEQRVLIEPFEKWLAANARRGGTDNEPGTVLVWRSTADGAAFHAAVTIGDGLAFEKSSQAWYSPYYVTSVDNIKRLTRMRGIRLERWRIVTG